MIIAESIVVVWGGGGVAEVHLGIVLRGIF